MGHRKKLLIDLTILFCVFWLPILNGCTQRNLDNSGATQSETFNAAPVWVFETTDSITSTPAADNDGRVYVRTSNSITALDVLTGKVLWTASSPSNVPLNIQPQVFGDYLIVPEKGSRLAVLDPHTGKLQWRTSVINPEFTHPGAIEIEDISFSQDIVYVARFNWPLTAYRLTDGQIVWQQDAFGRNNPYIASDQKAVYLGMGSMLKAFESESGILLWQKELEAYIGPMLLVDNTLYVLDEMHSSLIAINLSNQEILWNNSYPEAEPFEFSCLSEFGDKLLIAAQKLIAVARSDGQVIWSTNNVGRLECPTVVDNKIFVRNTKDALYTFELVTGNEVGKMRVSQNTSLKHEPNRSPISVAGLLIVPVSANQIVAYQP
jgi:outer membrane protein assembly factor BamB